MGKIVKIFGLFILLLAIVIAGLSLFVRYYLTEERVKALVVPEVEKTLGRTVTIGKIESSLFSGITINDFSIKEEDGKTDFFKARAFVLRYNLWPLLNKKVQISELLLEQPTVRITRNAEGSFNYQTLAPLAGKKEQKTPPTTHAPAEEALPIALSVDRISVQQASFHLDDALGELPTVNTKADLEVRGSLGQDMESLSYAGTLSLTGDAVYGEVKPTFSGKASFDEKNLQLALQLNADDQSLNADGSVEGYRTTPKIALDLTSKKLDVDKLLALTAGLPKNAAKQKVPAERSRPKSATPLAKAIPNGLTASGKIAVEKALYHNTEIDALLLRYSLANGILHIGEMGAVAMDGSLTGAAELDLNQPEPAFKGNVDLSSVEASKLCSTLAHGAEPLSGKLRSSVEFAGSGFDWNVLKNTLTADGDYALTNGEVKETPLTGAIATLLGMPQLRNIAFNDLSGTFKVLEGGKVNLQSSLQAADLQAQTSGNLGLDGSLDFPLTLKLSPALSSKLGGQAKFTKFLQDSEGNTVLNLKIAGTIDSPRPVIDAGSVKKQVTETIKEKIFEKLENREGTGSESGSGKGSAGSPLDALKGLFK